MGSPADFTVVELGAGREEMREALSAFRYVPVDIGRGALPDRFTGVVFTNEFFDALPVEVAVRRDGGFRELRVGWNGSRFEWVEAGAVTPEVEDYIRRYIGPREEGEIVEASLAALAWLDRIAGALERGYVLTIDYGYTRRESFRFPSGTLMSYHRHTALEDVLAAPGERDITAHVCFTALEEHGRARGLIAWGGRRRGAAPPDLPARGQRPPGPRGLGACHQVAATPRPTSAKREGKAGGCPPPAV